MKIKSLFAAAAMAVGALFATDSMAYDLPSLNLGGTSFYDGGIPPTGPGLYAVEYLNFYSAGRFNDNNGHRLPLPNQDLFLFAPVTQGVYFAPFKLFGVATPGFQALLPVVANNRVNDGLGGAALKGRTGVGDLTMGPMLMFDPIMGPKGPIFVQAIEFDFIVPTGSYNPNIAVNPGSNFFSFNPFYAATLWVTPEWSFSGRFYFLWNGVNNAPSASLGPSALYSQAGTAFHTNLTTQYQINQTWAVGINAYVLQQLSDFKVNGVAVPGQRERVFAVGPGLILNLSKDYSVFLNYYKEFSARNRTEGQKLVLRFNAHF